MSVESILKEAAKLFEDRNAVYGDNYLKVGQIMACLFPEGVELKTSEDHDRFHILMLVVVKLSRYVHSWQTGGHPDSTFDGSIYMAMLHHIDQCQREEREFKSMMEVKKDAGSSL